MLTICPHPVKVKTWLPDMAVKELRLTQDMDSTTSTNGATSNSLTDNQGDDDGSLLNAVA
jgi:hypothetical protein